MNIMRRLKQLLIVSALFYGWHIPFDSTLSAAQIPVASVKVIGSDPAVLKFDRSSTLETFGIVPGTMNIATSNTAHWPSVGEGVDPNDRDGQAGTLWIFLNINGQWHATGAERLRKYQLNGNKPEADPAQGGLATLVGEGWLYDVNRWREMTGYNPQPGEHVGFMVAAGSTRSDNNTPVKQRTNIIEVVWPDARGANPMRVVWNEANAGGGGQSGDSKSRMVAELKRQRAKYGTLDRVSAGALLNDAAFALRNEGWVLLGKKSGNNCDQPKTGTLVSCDFMVHGPSQRGWDVLIAWDAPGGGGITNMDSEGEDLSGVIADGSRTLVSPVDNGGGGGGPVDPPVDPTVGARLAALEAAKATLEAQVASLVAQLNDARGELSAQRDVLNNFLAQLGAQNAAIEELKARPAPPSGCRATLNLGFARIPASCELVP